jgi:HAE1 family hydrophobic/amphiphilic exporter-1
MGAVGGMLVGTILGVFVIPILFIIFQSLQERISGKPFAEKEVEVPLLEEENEK